MCVCVGDQICCEEAHVHGATQPARPLRTHSSSTWDSVRCLVTGSKYPVRKIRWYWRNAAGFSDKLSFMPTWFAQLGIVSLGIASPVVTRSFLGNDLFQEIRSLTSNKKLVGSLGALVASYY